MNDRSFNNPAVSPQRRAGGAVGLDSMAHSFDNPLPVETLDLVEYWRSIAKRKWSILGLVLLVALLTTLVVFSLRPSYRSTTTLLIEQGKSKVVSIEEVYNGMGGNREYYQTQVEILKSNELSRKVIQKLELTKHVDFDMRQDSAQPWWPTQWFKSKVPFNDDDVLKTALKRLGDDLQIQPVRNSQLVQISFTAYDRELSAKVPNMLAELYIESDLEARVAMTQKASAWLTERMGDLRKKLESSEKSLQDYRERERIVDAKGLVLSGASRALEDATSNLVSVRAKRAEAEALYNQVQSVKMGRATGGYESIPAVLRHPTVQRLKESEAMQSASWLMPPNVTGPSTPKCCKPMPSWPPHAKT